MLLQICSGFLWIPGGSHVTIPPRLTHSCEYCISPYPPPSPLRRRSTQSTISPQVQLLPEVASTAIPGARALCCGRDARKHAPRIRPPPPDGHGWHGSARVGLAPPPASSPIPLLDPTPPCDQLGAEILGCSPCRLGRKVDHQSVTQHRQRDVFHVVEIGHRAAVERGPRFRAEHEVL